MRGFSDEAVKFTDDESEVKYVINIVLLQVLFPQYRFTFNVDVQIHSKISKEG
jgi:hypothetical protein